jgi:pimeloyl-ACP methyl ester carboxylesterase
MHSVTSRDGTTIAYDHRGSGPAFIVVDGAMTTRMSSGKAELVNLLAPHFTVYTYDRRGRGDSGDTLPYTVEREIEDIEALVNVAGTSAALYGHSSGGCLALEAARSLGSRVAKVVVYEAPYNDDTAAQHAWAEYIRQLGEALAAGRRGDAVALFMRYVGNSREQIAGMRQAPFWAGMQAIGPTLAYDHIGIIGRTAEVPKDKLARVSVPVLALCGGASYPFMCVTARTIAEAVPSGEHRTLPGQTHQVQPAAIAPALIEFLEAKRDGGSD